MFSVRDPFSTLLCMSLVLIWAMGLSRETLGQIDENSPSSSFFFGPDSKATAWAVERENGRIFVTFQSQNKIVEYSRSGERLRETKTPLPVQHLTFKNGKLIVVYGEEHWRESEDGQTFIAVLDPIDNQLSDVTILPGITCTSLFCSQVENNFVYAMVRGRAPERKLNRNPFLVRVNLADASVKTANGDEEWPVGMREGMLTDNGTYLRLDNRVFAFDESLFRLGGKFLTGTDVVDSDPVGRYWGHQGSQGITDVEGADVGEVANVIGFHPKFSLCLAHSRKRDAICFFPGNGRRDNNFKKVKKIAGESTQVHFDDQNRAYYCTTKGCQIIKLDQFVELEPYFLIDVPKRVEVVVGQELELPLSVFTGGESESVQYSVEPQSKGFVIRGSAVSWTPSADDLGVNKLTITAISESGRADSFPVEVNVTSAATIDSGIAIKAFIVDRAGTRALVWGKKFNESTKPRELNNNKGAHVVAIADLENRAMIAETEVRSIHTASLDEKYVYVISSNRQQLTRYDRDTLANEKTLRIKQSYSGEIGLFPFGDTVMVNDQVNYHVIDRDSLTLLERSNKERLGRTRHSFAQIEIDGRVSDIDTGELHAVTVKPLFEGKPSRYVPYHRQRTPYLGQRYDYRLFHSQATIGHESFARTGQRQSLGRVAAPNQPLIYELFCQGDTYELEAHRMLDSKLVSKKVVSNYAQNRVSKDSAFVSGRIKVASNKIVLARFSTLEIHAFPVIKEDLLISPLNIKYPPFRPLESTSALILETEVEGAENEILSFELKNPVGGMAIDAQSGELSIDTPTIWAQFVYGKAIRMLNIERSLGRAATVDFRKENDNSPLAAEIYEEIFGESLGNDKYPLARPVEILVSSPGGQTDSCSCYFIIVGDKQDFAVARRMISERFRIAATGSSLSAVAATGSPLSVAFCAMKTMLDSGALQEPIPKLSVEDEDNPDR